MLPTSFACLWLGCRLDFRSVWWLLFAVYASNDALSFPALSTQLDLLLLVTFKPISPSRLSSSDSTLSWRYRCHRVCQSLLEQYGKYEQDHEGGAEECEQEEAQVVILGLFQLTR